MDRRARQLFWLALTVVTVALLAPLPEGPGGGHRDKLVHAFLFGVLGLLARAGFGARTRPLALLLGYGLLTEVLQGLGGYRSFEWLDWLADGVGLLCAGILPVSLFPRPSKVAE